MPVYAMYIHMYLPILYIYKEPLHYHMYHIDISDLVSRLSSPLLFMNAEFYICLLLFIIVIKLS